MIQESSPIIDAAFGPCVYVDTLAGAAGSEAKL